MRRTEKGRREHALELSHAHLLQLVASFSWVQALTPSARKTLLADLAAQMQPAPAPIRLPLRTLIVTARREGR
jgi:hypothetical protein